MCEPPTIGSWTPSAWVGIIACKTVPGRLYRDLLFPDAEGCGLYPSTTSAQLAFLKTLCNEHSRLESARILLIAQAPPTDTTRYGKTVNHFLEEKVGWKKDALRTGTRYGQTVNCFLEERERLQALGEGSAWQLFPLTALLRAQKIFR